MASIAKTIADAITKVSSDEIYANMEFATREEARDNFTAALLYELGLGPKPAAVHAPVVVSEPAQANEKPKETGEPAVATKKKRASKKDKVEELTEKVGQLALEEAPKMEDELKKEEPKPKKARKTKEPAPAPAKEPHMGIGAGVPPPEPVAEPVKVTGEPAVATKKKPGPKPKAVKAEGPLNLEKLNPTQKKHLKEIAKELNVEPKDKEFLAYANGMSAEEWSGKQLDEHIRAFLMPAPVPLADPPTEFEEVEFDGEIYLVDPETKFVYENAPEGAPVRNKLGVVGQLKFKDMDY